MTNLVCVINRIGTDAAIILKVFIFVKGPTMDFVVVAVAVLAPLY